jgi:hypothetical protein
MRNANQLLRNRLHKKGKQHMTACRCGEKKRAIKLPRGSNDRPRQWFVITRNRRLYKSPGLFGSHWSDYSTVHCRVCDAYWKTKAPYVSQLDNCEYFPHQHPPKMEAITQ